MLKLRRQQRFTVRCLKFCWHIRKLVGLFRKLVPKYSEVDISLFEGWFRMVRKMEFPFRRLVLKSSEAGGAVSEVGSEILGRWDFPFGGWFRRVRKLVRCFEGWYEGY